jgi:hypothetical protein
LSSQAQAEADRRVVDRERSARESYSVRYGARVAELDEEYRRESAAVAAEYLRILDSYRVELGRKQIDEGRFSALVDDLLFKVE